MDKAGNRGAPYISFPILITFIIIFQIGILIFVSLLPSNLQTVNYSDFNLSLSLGYVHNIFEEYFIPYFISLIADIMEDDSPSGHNQ